VKATNKTTSSMTQIADIQSLDTNTVIPEMSFNVKAVYPPKSPKAPYNLVVTDSTGEVRLGIWSDVDLSDLRNQHITVRSTATRKGLDGLRVSYSDWAKKKELSCNKNGKIFTDAELAAAGPLSNQQPHAPVTSKSPIGGSNGGVGVAPYNATPAVGPKEFIHQNAQLMVECVKAAKWVDSQIEDGVSADHLQAIASSLFIAAERAGLARTFTVTESKPKAQPKDELEQEAGW